MIKSFLFHHLERARRGEITSAFANCHCKGLFSIMLHDEPGNRVRMFIASTEHELITADGRPSLAVHPHRTDICLTRIYGQVTNHVLRPVRYDASHLGGQIYKECSYSSGIDEESALTETGTLGRLVEVLRDVVGDCTSLRAEALHTVTVERGRSAAWLVFEGAPNKTYKPYCWSLAPDEFDPRSLYVPIDPNDVPVLIAGVITSL